MHIKSIEIENWRSIKNVKIDAEKIMMFIGQNNHGKSNLLSAILFFFREAKPHDDDFHKADEANELFVEIEFTDLTDIEKNTFKSYLTPSKNIIVRKTSRKNGTIDYKGRFEVPEDKWLQASEAGNYTKREEAEKLPLKKFLPESGRLTKQHVIDAQEKYIEENRDNIKFNFNLAPTDFFGSKNVAQGMLGKVYFIPAVKEASDDFTSKSSSAFGKIYADMINTISDGDKRWSEIKEQLGILFKAINKNDSEGNPNNERPKELQSFENKLKDVLKDWQAEIEIEVSTPDIESIIKDNTQVKVDDGYKTDIERKGHGLQRRLIIALIEVIAGGLGTVHDEENISHRQASKSKYLIFEEPELYLHPQAQRLLFKSLISLSDKDFQVILSTHSSAFIDLERYESIYIVTKNAETGTTVKTCNESIFAGDQKQKKKEFNLAYYINPDRGELFFAEKVILVEGQTDKVALPVLAEKLNIFIYDSAIIDCGSKLGIPIYIELLNKFEIPYVAVFDSDGEKEDFTPITSIIKEGLGEIAIFENDIEYEIGMKEGDKKGSKPLSALNFIKSDKFVFSEKLEQKIRDIYS